MIFQEYFTLIAVVLLSIQCVMTKRQLASIAELSAQDRKEVNRFVLGYSAVLVGPVILLEILRIVGGFADITQILKHGFDNPFSTIAWGIQLTLGALQFWWVWFGNGVNTISKFRSAFGGFSDSPAQIKFSATIMSFVPFLFLAATRFLHSR